MKKYVVLIAVMLLGISTARSQYNMLVHTIDGSLTSFNVNTIDSVTWVEESILVPVMKIVDLGLSVKWAAYNVGATSPEEYGDYFDWYKAKNLNFSGSWRIPTKAEFDELMNSNNCTWTWTKLNGIQGYKVQSRKSGYTDNWIFLPAAGHSNGSFKNVNTDGYYWSSSPYPKNTDHSYALQFSSKEFRLNDYRQDKDLCLSVRAVCQ